MGERLHAIIKASAPELSPKLWYGMPAYAKDGSVICFFQAAQKFKTRYATLGFSDKAKLDEGTMWPNAFALMDLTAADEARIARAGEESGELRTLPISSMTSPHCAWQASARRLTTRRRREARFLWPLHSRSRRERARRRRQRDDDGRTADRAR